MNRSRRSFLRNTALLTAGATLANSSLFALAKKGELTGIQLYSIRTDMSKDPMGTLTKLSKMGYKHVEHANYINRKFYGWTATEFKKILDDLGMTMPSGHTVMTSKHYDASKKILPMVGNTPWKMQLQWDSTTLLVPLWKPTPAAI
jgi:hypothetical protein